MGLTKDEVMNALSQHMTTAASQQEQQAATELLVWVCQWSEDAEVLNAMHDALRGRTKHIFWAVQALRSQQQALAQAPVLPAGAGVGQLLATPVRDRFVALLAKANYNQPDEGVLDVIERCCPHHMMVCSRPTTAAHLYQDAKLLPRSSTKAHFFEQHQLRINGPLFSDPLQGPPSLLAATRNRRACIVKMLRDPLAPGAHGQPGGREAAAVQALMTDMPQDMPLVPCQLVTLQLGSEHVSTGRAPGVCGALVMPRYISSVVRVSPGPDADDILLGGRRMVVALEYIHKKDHVHMDVKADNFLVDNEGDWWLADLGGTVPTGQPVEETTEWCAPLNIMGTPAVPQYDWHMLAVALITLIPPSALSPPPSVSTATSPSPSSPKAAWEKLLVEDEPKRHVPLDKLRAAVKAVTHTGLAELLKDLLTRADIEKVSDSGSEDNRE